MSDQHRALKLQSPLPLWHSRRLFIVDYQHQLSHAILPACQAVALAKAGRANRQADPFPRQEPACLEETGRRFVEDFSLHVRRDPSEEITAIRRREWSDWESRHGRLSREGNGRESRAAAEIQLYGGRPRALVQVRLAPSWPRESRRSAAIYIQGTKLMH
jgi:hypothetical protein